jgi:TRAP-type C4-dicarboxylate transport system permease small subunit
MKFLVEWSKWRIIAWLLVIATPLVCLLVYYSWNLLNQSQGCAIMACIGSGMGAILIPILIYFIAVIFAAIFNLVDLIKTRKTADFFRYIELIIFFSIPCAVFSIPAFL